MSHSDDNAFCVEVDHIAARSHTCTACRETITRGCRYTRIACIYEGSVTTVKQCSRCRAIFLAIADMSPREAILLALDCGESWLDTFGEPCPPEIEALAFMLPTETHPS